MEKKPDSPISKIAFIDTKAIAVAHVNCRGLKNINPEHSHNYKAEPALQPDENAQTSIIYYRDGVRKIICPFLDIRAVETKDYFNQDPDEKAWPKSFEVCTAEKSGTGISPSCFFSSKDSHYYQFALENREEQKKYEVPLWYFKFSPKVNKIFADHNITKLAHLLHLQEQDLLKFKGLAHKTLQEIREKLGHRGYKIGELEKQSRGHLL